jgi:tetratricopeptide (TPR) repeat protein
MLLPLLASCTSDPQVKAQRFVDQGNKFYNRGLYKEASIMYQRALKVEKKFGEAYYRLGLTDLKLAAYGNAAQMLLRAVDLQPQNTDAIVKLADLNLLASVEQKSPNRDREVAEVQELSEKLLQLNPQSFDGHRLRGQLALVNRDFPAAVKEFNAANQANPLQPDLCVSYFRALTANGQAAEAEKIARAVIEKEKKYSPMYDLLYLEYRRQNRLEDGEQLLKLKTANNPDNASYFLQLATHYYLMKRRDEMETIMSQLNDEKRFPEGHLLAGDFFFFRLREFDRAQQQYEAAIAAFPKDKAMYQKRMVELYATKGKNPEANQLLAVILKENPKDNDAVAMRAALMLTTGDRNQINLAANDLQSLVAKSPQNHLLRYNLARALIAKNDLEGARLQLEDAIKYRSDFVAARELLARLHLARRDYGKALQAAEELITVDPSNLQGHLVRSSALLQLQQLDKAHSELDFISKTYPQNSDARYQMGLLAWQDKDYKKAEQVFGELYKSNPKDPRGLMGITETYAAEKRMDEAIAVVKKAVDAEPDSPGLRIALGNLYTRAARYDESIAIFKALVDKDPKSSDLLFKLAETYRQHGDTNLAIDYFRRSSDAAPNNADPLLRLALMLDDIGKRDQALPIYERILTIQPDESTALNNLAFIKASQGTDLEGAFTMAQRARQKDPNNPNVQDTLGWIFIKKNQTEDAVRIFRDLVAKYPTSAVFHYHYAMALFQKGDRVSAKRELSAALGAKPPLTLSTDDKVQAQALLQKL